MASKKKRQYDQHALEEAVQRIHNNEISLHKASSTYHIPKGTLHNKLHGKTPLVCRKGPDTMIKKDEEDHIATWVIGMAKIGYPVGQDDLKETVALLFEKRGQPDTKPGKKWFHLFMKRHPEITQRHAEVISKARAAVTEGSIRKWFSDLQLYLQEQNYEDILNCPERIFNLDETGVQLCPKTGVILAPKNYRALYTVASGQEKQCVTVLCNFSAAGGIVPPFVVYPLKRLSKEIAQSMPEEWGMGRSDTGWMTGSTFLQYVQEIFLPWLEEQDITLPVVLFVDGHKSHFNMELHDFCVEHKIILYCLHPNTTHILQPCDVGIFGPLKAAWKNAVRKHKLKENFQLTRSNFAKVFSKAFEKSMSEDVIKSAFEACGLYPLNPDAVNYSKCISNRRDEVSKNVSLQEYKTTISVIEKTVSKKTLERYVHCRAENKKYRSSLFQFWEKCKNKVEDIMTTQSNIEDHDIASRSEADNNIATTSALTQKRQEEDLSLTLGIDSIVEGLLNIENLPMDIEEYNQLLDDARVIEAMDNRIDTTERSLNDHIKRSKALPRGISLTLNMDNQEGTNETSQMDDHIEQRIIPLNGAPLNDMDNQEDNAETAQLNDYIERRGLNVPTSSQNNTTVTSDLSYGILEPVTSSTPINFKTVIPLPWYTDMENKTLGDSVSEEPSTASINVSDLFKIPNDKKTVKRKLSNASAMPLAITSKKFREYIEKKENEKIQKSNEILKRKLEREQKKAEKGRIAKEKKSNVKKTKPRSKKDKALASAQAGPSYEGDISQLIKKTRHDTTEESQSYHTSSPSDTEEPIKYKNTANKDEANRTRKTDGKVQTKIPDMANIDIETYVVAEFKTNKRNRYYVGVVEEFDLETTFIKVKFLRKKSTKLDDICYFVEPPTVDLTEISITDVKEILPTPRVGRRGMLYFVESNFDLNLCE